MIPKEKAKDLLKKHTIFLGDNGCDEFWKDILDAKRHAIQTINEIYDLNLRTGMYLDEYSEARDYFAYWEDVKNELEKLK